MNIKTQMEQGIKRLERGNEVYVVEELKLLVQTGLEKFESKKWRNFWYGRAFPLEWIQSQAVALMRIQTLDCLETLFGPSLYSDLQRRIVLLMVLVKLALVLLE